MVNAAFAATPQSRRALIKPLVAVGSESLLGDLALVRWLQEDKWDAVWVDAYHDAKRHRIFWDGMRHETDPADLPQDPEAWDMSVRIVEENGGRSAGFFDVFAWRGGRLLLDIRRDSNDNHSQV
ncbi:hypothetical protein ACFLTC_02150 [Chloroflexota bacterium]